MISIFEKNGFTPLDRNYEDLEVFQKDSVGLISMKKFKDDIKAHRQSGNHLDNRLLKEIQNALALFEEMDNIHSLILTSSHKVAFSRGAKIEDVLGASSGKCREFLKDAQDLLLSIQSFGKPVIAAINGLTLGGGFELALACDYRISSTRENVIFGFPETSLGLIPAMGGTQNLGRVIEREKALGIISDAVVSITPEEAVNLGILEKTVAPRDLIGEAFSFAVQKNLQRKLDLNTYKENLNKDDITLEIIEHLRDKILKPVDGKSAAPIAMELTEFLFSKTSESQYLDGLLYEYEIFCYLQQTDDCREGIEALIGERPAVFKGK